VPRYDDPHGVQRSTNKGYYAFFVFDPDGMRVEVFCWPRPIRES
jgi:hypothetical protein